MTQSYDDLYWNSNDGLRLHARDHAPDAEQAARGTVVCIPGLTRNGADFDALADVLTAEGWRVIAVDLRGRAGSERAYDPSSYNPRAYADDMVALLRAQNIDKAVFVGTSLGVLVTITLASRAPGPQFQLRTHDWTRFLLDDVPRLEALGWKVEADEDFRHRITPGSAATGTRAGAGRWPRSRRQRGRGRSAGMQRDTYEPWSTSMPVTKSSTHQGPWRGCRTRLAANH